MSDIPEDIMKIAVEADAEFWAQDVPSGTENPVSFYVARAVLAERERSRQLLSEADKREAGARAKALEEAAQVAEKTGSDNEYDWPGETWIASCIAASIRALRSEER